MANDRKAVDEGDADMDNVDALLGVSLRMEMDRANKIETFEELGMLNPLNFRKSVEGAISYAKKI